MQIIDSARNRPTREISGSHLERQQQLVQYFLIRAAYGISLNIPVGETSKVEAGSLEVLYYSLDKSKSHTYWYYPEDYFLLSEEKKREVRPIIYRGGGSLPGVALADLIMKRDNGNGGLFRHIRRPTKKEAVEAINELVNQGILTPMTMEELGSTMRLDHDLTEQERDRVMRSYSSHSHRGNCQSFHMPRDSFLCLLIVFSGSLHVIFRSNIEIILYTEVLKSQY